MSKTEIMQELPRLRPEERHEILERICELEEREDRGPTPEEKALLDREFEDFRQNPETGSTWDNVEGRLQGAKRSTRNAQLATFKPQRGHHLGPPRLES